MAVVDAGQLEARVKQMYREVAEDPSRELHFETGRALAERLGYPPAALDRVPSEAVASFAGVGHFFHLAKLVPGEVVLDLGSGSGTDSFLAAHEVGPSGRVVGIDMTEAQIAKSIRLARAAGLANVEPRLGHIEETGLPSGSFDCVISNGVINLAADKPAVFREVARVLKKGGRLALSDIVTERPLPESVVCDVDLWAA